MTIKSSTSDSYQSINSGLWSIDKNRTIKQLAELNLFHWHLPDILLDIFLRPHLHHSPTYRHSIGSVFSCHCHILPDARICQPYSNNITKLNLMKNTNWMYLEIRWNKYSSSILLWLVFKGSSAKWTGFDNRVLFFRSFCLNALRIYFNINLVHYDILKPVTDYADDMIIFSLE